ncbi:signal peptidase I [Enterococcus pallens]|uniref:Signal peptidase I n=2 Tax=Enterococcus pallens TaxID=160454 RepID=R2T570_9ENTE|nr:signal peptidase I [Enterococcus pallens]EOH95384.1 signal peptidase I [Enterococcus pallens ATCC BAA-351]EOU21479.1 signal peptidase I [Enterococcus pallens ATCC BAA-351]
MPRTRDYRKEEPPYRERAPSERRPSRRYEEDDYVDDRYNDRRPRLTNHRSVPPRRNYNREYYPPVDRHQPPRGERRPVNHYHDERPRPIPRGYEREVIPPRQRPVQQRPASTGSQPLREAKASTNRKIFLFIYNLFFYTLTIGILLSSLMFAFSEKSDAAIFGHRFYRVLTDSMASQPDAQSKGFYSGDIVLVKMTDGSQVKEGDIVTFQVGDGDRYLTHRMVERLTELNGKEGDYIVTKGDANESKDPPIEASRVYGKVTFVIPRMGSVLNFVQENLWLCIVCVLSTFGFFLVLKAYFLQPDTVRESTKRNRYPNGV